MSIAAPMFSVVIPTYNRGHLIERTIKSIVSQDFKDFEVLVVDDGSNDNTAEEVGRFKDSGIQYFHKENAERGAARNYGAEKAKGQYVNFFDSDDLMYPHHLRTAHELIRGIGAPEFIHLGYDFKEENGSLIHRVNNFDDSIKRMLLYDNRLSCNGVFLRKDIASKFPFEENRILASSEDWELWIRLSSRFTLHFSNVITSSVINHDQRSLRTIAPEKIVARDLLLIEKLRQDSAAMLNFGKSFARFIAERYTFFMMIYAQHQQRLDVFKWGQLALRAYPPILLSKRFIASIKNSMFKW